MEFQIEICAYLIIFILIGIINAQGKNTPQGNIPLEDLPQEKTSPEIISLEDLPQEKSSSEIIPLEDQSPENPSYEKEVNDKPLEDLSIRELKKYASQLKIKKYGSMKKKELIHAILNQ